MRDRRLESRTESHNLHMTTSPIERTAAAFAAELGRWRLNRGLTKKQLAAQMGFDPSYLSHVERGRHRPTGDFARRADLVLQADGAIWQAYVAYDGARTAAGRARRDSRSMRPWPLPPVGLVVDDEFAQLSYTGDAYTARIRRSLYNAGSEPVTRYLVRVSVDRYPADPERSNLHHRSRPLTLDSLALTAVCGEADEQEPMRWRVKQDRDALKELWLLFENEQGRFPLYPGQRTTIEYSFTVDEQRWGAWFQRSIRLPTSRLRVALSLPASRAPQVWGVEISMAAGEMPLRTPVTRRRDGNLDRFEWETEAPPLHARYRLEWRFKTR